eukprot:GEMP01020674.1.p1 GENE.GEMP01020674.1~~GEMP01020674.1.p1  ORF type:complete len:658 (+),score=240.33 GEMP01020674.1:89-2062(+)
MRTALVAVALASANTVTPVQKIVEMLTGMNENGKKEKQVEEVQFAAYDQWCGDTTAERQRAIKEGNERIERLNADVAKFAADAAALGRQIVGHEADVAGWESDKNAATQGRQKEHTDFLTTEQDYAESISALSRAIDVLKSQARDRKQAKEALLQVGMLIPLSSKRVIDAFLAQAGEDDADHLAVAAPEANAYEFQSQSVVTMLEKLLDKFEDEHNKLQKEESNSKHAHQMMLQDLTGQISEANRQRSDKAGSKAQNLQNKASGEADLTDTTLTRDDDQKYLDDTSATCQKKKSDFANRQQLRADEIAAIEKAIEILSSDTVSGAAGRHLPKLVQKATSFLQLRRHGGAHTAQQQVVKYLQSRAQQLHSRVLSVLAVRAAEDPFRKVKEMVQDLITRLMEEANTEAEEKGFCDEALKSNTQTREEKTSRIEKLTAKKDGLHASIAQLSKDVAELSTQVAEINKAVATAIDLRAQEKATNLQTIQEAKDAQDAVSRALTVLQEFYAKAGLAKSFVQQPAIFDSPYQGQQGENKGVIGMLEVIQADFARLEAETETEESTSQREQDQFLEESSVDKAQKNTDIEHKTAKKQQQQLQLQETKGDLEGTQKELDAALKVYDSLKPRCVSTGVSYNDRVGRRQEEIESLQEALRILNGEEIA